ncbi:Cold shock-like protein CspC [subsurface metagenome]
MARQRGIVKMFKDESGYGFIKPDAKNEKDVFVFHKDIAVELSPGFRTLELGDVVDYILKETETGPHAVDVRVLVEAE